MKQTIAERATNPRWMGQMPKYHGMAHPTGHCGDSIAIYISVDEDKVWDISFLTRGCGYTIACADQVSEMAVGKALDEALLIEPDEISHALGGLPEDHMHCAELALTALEMAIGDYYQTRRRAGGRLYS